MAHRILTHGLALGLALLAPACGLTPEIPKANELAAAKAGGKTYETYERAKNDAEAAWGRRAEDPANIKKAIASWETAYAIDQNDRDSVQKLAIAHYYLANYYTPDPAEREKAHMRGHGYGVAAAQLNPAVREAMAVGKTLEEAIQAHASVGDVPGLYWMTVNLARAAENKGLATRAATAPKLKVVMETIYKLGPSYYWGGVHRFFGAYYIKAPAQSDPLGNSKQEFERAVKVGKENLENFVLYAEYYATAAQDQELFEKLLKDVIASKPENDIAPLRLDNAEARKRAKKLLEDVNERF